MNKWTSIGLRFLKAFIAGSLSTAVLITVTDPTNWQEVSYAFAALATSMMVGGINGVIMAAQKWWSWKM